MLHHALYTTILLCISCLCLLCHTPIRYITHLPHISHQFGISSCLLFIYTKQEYYLPSRSGITLLGISHFYLVYHVPASYKAGISCSLFSRSVISHSCLVYHSPARFIILLFNLYKARARYYLPAFCITFCFLYHTCVWNITPMK